MPKRRGSRSQRGKDTSGQAIIEQRRKAVVTGVLEWLRWAESKGRADGERRRKAEAIEEARREKEQHRLAEQQQRIREQQERRRHARRSLIHSRRKAALSRRNALRTLPRNIIQLPDPKYRVRGPKGSALRVIGSHRTADGRVTEALMVIE